jgi:hypothetical protein
MVLVVPPPGWTHSGDGAPAIASSTSAPPVSVEPTSPPMQFVQVSSPSEEAADAFAEAASLATRPVVEQPAATDTVAEITTTVERSATTLTTWLLGGGVVAAVLVVGGLAVAMLSGGSAVDEVVVPQSSKDATHVVEASTPDNDREPTVQAEEDLLAENAALQVTQKPVSEPEQESISEATDKQVVNDSPASAGENSEERATSPTTNHDQNSLSASSEETSTPPATTDDGQSERPAVLRFDPLDFDPAQLTFSSAAAAANEAVSTSVPEGTAADVPAPDETIETGQELADLPDVPAGNPSVTVRLGPIARGETNPVQVARQFAMRVESLVAPRMSLEQFVAFVSDLAAVPITIDPVALELAGVSPQAAVAVQTSGVTLDELARNGLSKHRLELVDQDGRMLLALAKGTERSTKRYDVSDLMATSAADGSEVARIVERFVSPTSWRTAGGGTIAVEGKRLRVDHVKSVHHELLIFCERWRLARGRTQRSQYPADRLSVELPYPQVKAKLNGRTTFTFLPWTRLDEVVRHWAEATGLTIFVDWSQLAAEELTPSTPIACSTVDRPWTEALDAIFEPLGLAWWAVNGQTIQITMQDALDGIERVEFYAVPKTIREQFDSKEAFLASLQSDLRQHIGDRLENGKLQMHVDVPSGRLIVRGTPVVHRYLSERLNSKIDR